MSTRTQRVEQMLRRALADILVRGDLRDPRLRDAAALSITAVKVSPDLGHALVYVDTSGGAHRSRPTSADVIDGLNAGASAIRGMLGGRIRLKRTPMLRFVVDESLAHGRRIEAVLAELQAERAPTPGEGEPAEPESEPESEPEPDDRVDAPASER